MFAETADIETASPAYATRFGGTTGRWFLERQTKLLLSLLPAGCRTVLDVGGGHGQVAFPLCKAGLRVTVTGSDEQCKMQIETLLKENSNCSFVVADNIKLPFPDKSFDIATSFRLLPHCGCWQKLISELCRVSKLSVIVDYPALSSVNIFAEKFFNLKKKIEGNTRHFRVFTHKEIEGSFRESGFFLKKRRGEFMFPMALHRAIRSKLLSQLFELPFNFFKLTDISGSPVIVRMDRKADVRS
jgi:ubiquinone/menaquinone biosynthesis C-methylase UbiE